MGNLASLGFVLVRDVFVFVSSTSVCLCEAPTPRDLVLWLRYVEFKRLFCTSPCLTRLGENASARRTVRSFCTTETSKRTPR